MALPAAKAGDRVLEIVGYEPRADGSEDIAHRSIVTGDSERRIEKLESGMLQRVDLARFMVRDRVLDADEPAGRDA